MFSKRSKREKIIDYLFGHLSECEKKRDFKKYTSSQIIKAIEKNSQESRRNWMLWIFKTSGKKNKKNKIYQFWRQNNQPKKLITNNFKHHGV